MSTRTAQRTLQNEMLGSLYLAFELSKKHWKVGFTIGTDWRGPVRGKYGTIQPG